MWQTVETLLQYGSGPAIAAGALLWQQNRTDKREDRRREEERIEKGAARETEERLLEAERRAQLQERWRDERKQAHASLLALLDKGAASARIVRNLRGRGRSSKATEWAAASAQLQSISEAAREAVSLVNLLGSSEARQAGDAAVRRLRLVSLGLRVAGITDERTKVDEHMSDLNQERDAYLRAARADLGTEDV